MDSATAPRRWKSRAHAQDTLDAANVRVAWPPCQDCVPQHKFLVFDVDDAVSIRSHLAELQLADVRLDAWLVDGWLFVRPLAVCAWLQYETDAHAPFFMDETGRAAVETDVAHCAARGH
jgi:hypothetical protein